MGQEREMSRFLYNSIPWYSIKRTQPTSQSFLSWKAQSKTQHPLSEDLRPKSRLFFFGLPSLKRPFTHAHTHTHNYLVSLTEYPLFWEEMLVYAITESYRSNPAPLSCYSNWVAKDLMLSTMEIRPGQEQQHMFPMGPGKLEVCASSAVCASVSHKPAY